MRAQLASVYIISLLAVGAGHASAEQATAPDRCAYATVAAALRTGLFVSAQVVKLEAGRELESAQAAVALARDLQCPKAALLKAIDCTIEKVLQKDGANPEILDAIDCVEKALGRSLPKFAR